MLDRLRADGQPVTVLLADRAWSYKLPDRWAHQLRDRGIEQVVDLHPNDHGASDLDGMRMIAGTAHCPATPDELIDIRRPATLGAGPELDEFTRRIDERSSYAFRRTAGPNARGDERAECPAEAGKLRCPLKPTSLLFPAEMLTIGAPPDAATAPACCTQRTVKIPAAADAKVRQRHIWGSPGWIRSFRRRTYVEGAFGNLKNPNTEAVRRGWIAVVGLVKTSLMLGCAAVAMNLRLLRAWAQRTGDHTDPLTTPDPDDHGFEELEPAGGPPATGPPATDA